MHEMSIAYGLIDQVERIAREHGAERVSAVELEVGQRKLVVPEALDIAWQAVSDGTVAEGARLAQTEVAVVARCQQCGARYAPESEVVLACPTCNVADAVIEVGDDIVLKSLELDVAETAVTS